MKSRSINMRQIMANILRLEQACAEYSGTPGSLTFALSLTGEIQRALILQELSDTQHGLGEDGTLPESQR